ncbi:secreted seminal-vesicle Ly-6 protein 1-like [Octodon degus]|uniref:Secreted seminal-vesicle Ly-6 protein 1-like n=1 Tax=Octodon degus TaxID=10160 RepID=A0A6P6DB67_OCTDE|nr:secreted seminal-vesicle Ly-6 protein 1-like [Octodon degus]
MGKLLKLAFFLLCMGIGFHQIAFTLHCKKCLYYYDGKCGEVEKTCTAENGQVCFSLRVSENDNWSHPEHGYSDCTGSCISSYQDNRYFKMLYLCCDSHDYCNDLSEPLDDFLASVNKTYVIYLLSSLTFSFYYEKGLDSFTLGIIEPDIPFVLFPMQRLQSPHPLVAFSSPVNRNLAVSIFL